MVETKEQALESEKRKTAELKRSNKELKRFASIVAHDIQEPLRTIEAFAERLEKMTEGRLGEKEVDYLSRIRSAARRMSQFTDDLLLYSKITTKERNTELVNLNEILREVRQDLESAIQEGGVHIEVSPLPSIRADPMQMRQLFLNLLSNAVKFTQKVPKPRVIVRSRVADGGTFEVSVSDNGIGFDPAYAERIFEPFERLHDREDYPGNGMGLAVCRRIVEKHNGTITAEGEAGEGATFRVVLPS